MKVVIYSSSINASMSKLLASAISIDMIAKESNLSWAIDDRKYVFISLRLLNDLLAVATVTGNVNKNYDSTLES